MQRPCILPINYIYNLYNLTRLDGVSWNLFDKENKYQNKQNHFLRPDNPQNAIQLNTITTITITVTLYTSKLQDGN